MALIAVGVAILRGEVGHFRVAEREWIALVVVVRLVLRVCVVDLELQIVRRPLRHAECYAVIEALCARLDCGQRADAVASIRSESGAPWRSEKRIVAVD